MRVLKSLWIPLYCAILLVNVSSCGSDSSSNNLSVTQRVTSTANLKLDVRAQEYLVEGQKAFQMGQYEQAMVFLDSAEVFAPGAPVIPFNRGRIFTALNRVNEARDAFNIALARDPGYPEVRFRLGDIELQLGELEKAVHHYREEAKIEPATALFVNMGEAYYRLGKADSAQIAYEKAIAVDSTNAEAHMMHGQLLEELGQLEEALAHSRQALALDPTRSNYQFAVGSQLFQLGRLEEAVPYLKQAADGRLLHYPAQYNLGQALIRLGRESDAQYYLSRADSSRELMDRITNTQSIAAQNPNSVEGWIELGELFRRAGERDRAVQAFNRALAIAPGNIRVQNNVGEMMLAEGDVRGAVQQFQSILRKDEQQPVVWKNLGLAFAVAGLCDDARMALEIAREHAPNDATINDLIAGVCTGKNQ